MSSVQSARNSFSRRINRLDRKHRILQQLNSLIARMESSQHEMTLSMELAEVAWRVLACSNMNSKFGKMVVNGLS